MRINGKKINVEAVFIVLIIISLALENFKLFTIMGASFKPIQAVAAFAVVYCFLFHAIDVKKIMWTIAFLAIPLAPLYRISDKTEFFKTYVIYAIIVVFVCFALPHLKKTFCENPKMYLSVFNTVITVLCILGIVQFILMNAFDIMFLEGIFGTFQFHFSATTIQSGFYRAYSLFHEPSYFGWVLDIALAINLIMLEKKLEPRKILFIIMLIITIILTISSSALWIMAMVLIAYLFSIRKININMVIGALIVVGILIVVVALIDVSFITNSMTRLFREINTENTSGYERITTPIEYIKATMQNYPLFGRGFGQEGNIDKVGTIGQYKVVNNSVFGSVVILGLTSIVYYVWLAKQFFGKAFTKETRMKRILMFVAILGMYFSTGAFLSFDTFIFTTIIMFVLSSMETKNIELSENCKEQEIIDENINNCSRL